MLVKYVSIDCIPQAFVFFRFVDLIVITVHDRFWNEGQANCMECTCMYFPGKIGHFLENGGI
jgi:hypothetical protein